MIDDAEVARLGDACRDHLGPQDTWRFPAGYPRSLALCLIDAIWSLGAHYDRHVVPVLTRYRALRAEMGADADVDGARSLLASISSAGGPSEWADLLHNHQRTSTRNGVLKAQAVASAANLMRDRAVDTPQELVASARASDAILRGWRRIPGQRSSLTGWRYLLILAGAPEVKPDRMILSFLRRFVAADVDPDRARELVVAVAAEFDVSPVVLDHRIWQVESGRVVIG